jgi:hypothetical protein
MAPALNVRTMPLVSTEPPLAVLLRLPRRRLKRATSALYERST